MINLVRIYLKNFAALYHSLGLSEIEINRYDSPNKIVLIIGPNASGKSSLLSEFTPLPLEHTNNRTKSRIIEGHDGVKELEYIVDDEWVYKIHIEYTKKTNCYISKRHILDDEFKELNPTGNVSTYMEVLERELGFSKNYTKVGYLSSTITNFINMKPSERNEYISEWLPNISLFLQGYKSVQKLHNLKRREIENINKDLGKMLSIDYELKLNELRDSMKYISDEIQSINNKIVQADVYLKEWSNYIPQFNALNQLKNAIFRNVDKVNKEKITLQERYNMIKEYSGKKGEKLLNEEIKNTEKYRDLCYKELESIEKEFQRLWVSVQEKQVNTNDKVIDKSLGEVMKFLEEQEKELNELKQLEESITKDNEKALMIFENMETNYIYEFFGIADYISSMYALIDKEGATSFDEVKKTLDNLMHTLEETELEIDKYNSEIENLSIEKRRLDDSTDLKDLLKETPNTPSCNSDKCGIIRYLSKFLDIKKSKDDIDQKIDKLRIIKENKVHVQDIVRDKIMAYNRIIENVEEINNFLYKKHVIFAHFSPFLIDLLSISDPFFIINKIMEIKALIPSFKEFIQFKEKVKNLENSIIDLKNTKNEIIIKNDIDKELAQMEALSMQKANVKNNITMYDAKLEDLEDLINSRDRIINDINEYNKKVETVNNQKSQFLVLVDAAYYYKSLSESKSKLEQQKFLKTKELDELEVEREKLKTDFINKQQMEKIRNTLLEELNRYKTLMEIWSPKIGYPAWEIEDFLYRLKEETNTDLNSLWFSNLTVEDFEIGQNMFSIIVRSNETLIPDASELSESERATLALAISFAIIGMNLANKKYNITRLDEQDGMLDGVRRKAFLSTIESMIERMDCRTCFIITHNNEFESTNADVILLTNLNNNVYSHLLKNKNILFHL